MDTLIKQLKLFAKYYKDDPEGLESDFSILTGYSISELCDRLDDEIQGLKG